MSCAIDGVGNRILIVCLRLFLFQLPDGIRKKSGIQIQLQGSALLRISLPVRIIIGKETDQLRIIHRPADRGIRHIIIFVHHSFQRHWLHHRSLLQHSVNIRGNQTPVGIQHLCSLYRILPVSRSLFYHRKTVFRRYHRHFYRYLFIHSVNLRIFRRHGKGVGAAAHVGSLLFLPLFRINRDTVHLKSGRLRILCRCGNRHCLSRFHCAPHILIHGAVPGVITSRFQRRHVIIIASAVYRINLRNRHQISPHRTSGVARRHMIQLIPQLLRRCTAVIPIHDFQNSCFQYLIVISIGHIL